MSGLRPPKFSRKPRSRDVSEARGVADLPNSSHTVVPDDASATVASTSGPRDSSISVSRPSTHPLVGPSTTPGMTHKFVWKNMKEFARLPNLVGPFKAFADGLVECAHLYEDVSKNQEEFVVLQKELEELFEELNKHLTSNASPEMTTSVRNICSSIHGEMEWVKGKKDRTGLKRAIEVGEDADEVLACYRRIQSHIQRLLLNININIWRIVDEIVAENRLAKLSTAQSAQYDSAQALEVERGGCTPGTRMGVFKAVFEWMDDPFSGCIYWLNGMAGTGKTTIAYSLCAELDAKHRLAASFFCSRTLPECRNISLIIPFIAYQLAWFSRPFRCELLRVLAENPGAHTKHPHLQFDMLISRPLAQARDPWPSNSVVLIDALDECDNRKGTSIILEILLTRAHNLPIKFFISSRPEPAIRDQMSKPAASQVSSQMVLHELDKNATRMDIGTYLKAALSEMPDPPSDQQIIKLAERADVLFIYAATIVRYITYDGFGQNPRARLDVVLNRSSESTNRHKEIDELYTTILQVALCDSKLDDKEKDDRKQVLHTVICAQEPLTIPALSALLKMDECRVNAALRPLWSVIYIVEPTKLVTPLHTSFADYMFDATRSQEYYCDQKLHNRALALLCFECIKNTRPQFNICGLQSSYVRDHKVKDIEERVKQAIPTELFYACRYWVAHLISSNAIHDGVDWLKHFLMNHLLLWMEVMNLKKCLDQGIQAVHAAEVWCRHLGHSNNILDLIHDAWRFAMTVASNPVSQSTPHIYISMLPLWPKANPISQHYATRTKNMIRVIGTTVGFQQSLLAKWQLAGGVSCGSFSPDGTRFAVGVGKTIHILDSFSGQDLLHPLEGHFSSVVTSVQYSPDGTYIASGSWDNTVHIWDIRSGKLMLEPLGGHMGPITLLAFSPDSTSIASGSDMCIQVWEIPRGTLRCSPHQQAQGNLNLKPVSVRYSPDGSYLAGCMEDMVENKAEVAIWDARSGQTLGRFETSCPFPGSSFGWYPDSTRIVFCCNNTVYTWDAVSKQLAPAPLRVGNDVMTPMGFSDDCTRIVMFSDGTWAERSSICVFDVQNGQIVLGPLEGFSSGSRLSFAYFSSDGTRIVASELGAKTIYVFDTYNGRPDPVVTKPNRCTGIIYSVGYSPDGVHIVSSINFTSIAVWNAQTGHMVLGPLMGHNSFITSVQYSHDGTHILSCSEDNAIRTWDAQNGHSQLVLVPRKLDSLGGKRAFASYSPDDAYIVCTWSGAPAIYVLNVHDEQMVLGPLRVDNTTSVQEVGFSPNGTVVMASTPLSIYTWNAHTGQRLVNIPVYEGPPGRSNSVSNVPARFSPDSTRIALARVKWGCAGTIAIWDIGSGCQIFEWHAGPNRIPLLEYSPDGAQIMSGSEDGVIHIWDAHTGKPVFGPLDNSDYPLKILKTAYSPDGTQIVSISDAKTMHVWNIQDICATGNTPLGSRQWKLGADGWVTDEGSNLLMWVLPHLRDSLMRARSTLMIGSDDYTRLDFEDSSIGESWIHCYTPV